MNVQDRLKTLKIFAILVDKRKKREPKDTTVIPALGLYLTSEWRDLALPLIKQAGKLKRTKSAVNAFLARVDKRMGQFQGNVEERISADIEYLYRFAKVDAIKRMKLKAVEKAKKAPKIGIGFWSEADTEAIAAIERQTGWSTASFYSESVQATVAESVRVNVFERGLTLEETGVAVKKDLEKAFRLKPGALESKVIPPGFRGTAGQYFSGLAETQAQFSRTSSSLYAMNDAGAMRYVVRSLKTNRTCIGCISMDGQEFTVRRGLNHLEKMLNAETKEDLKAAQPSFHFDVPGANSPAKEAAAEKLLNDGKPRLPSFHFRCECYVDMA